MLLDVLMGIMSARRSALGTRLKGALKGGVCYHTNSDRLLAYAMGSPPERDRRITWVVK
jgi:hypothetical protein